MYIYLCDRDQIKDGEAAIRRFGMLYAQDTMKSIQMSSIESALISRNSAGKPFFSYLHDIHFSVSHSGDIWACAFEGTPIGLDIEAMDRPGLKITEGYKEGSEHRWRKIAQRFFEAEEYDFVCKGGMDAFFQIWVCKEAYVKYKGTRLLNELQNIKLVEDGRLLPKLPDAYIEKLDLGKGLIGAYCAGEQKPVEKILDYRRKI